MDSDVPENENDSSYTDKNDNVDVEPPIDTKNACGQVDRMSSSHYNDDDTSSTEE